MMPHPSKTREERIKKLLAWAEEVMENPEHPEYTYDEHSGGL